MAAILAVVVPVAWLGRGTAHAHLGMVARPNILLINVDDEPARYRRALRFVNGISAADFPSTMINNPRCCPSRATLLTGQYSHHTGVETNYQADRLDASSTIATWLDPSYDTALVGKYLNEWENIDGIQSIPPGWDHWFAHFGRFDHYDYSVSDDGEPVHFGTEASDYGTHVYGERALQFIENADEPFFLYYTPLAPHTPFKPSQFHANEYSHWKPHLPPNFNQTSRGAPSFYRHRHKTSRRLERKRIVLISRMLRSVDASIKRMVNLLADQGELANTYIVFTSDNGLSLGSHRWWRKGCPYEECVRVPLRVSGPGVVAGTSTTIASNADLAPTLADLAGVSPPEGTKVDGVSLVPYLRGVANPPRHPAILLHAAKEKRQGPSFWAVRSARYKLIKSGDGSVELYDLTRDRYELHNVAGKKRYRNAKARLSRELSRLRQ